MLTDNIASITQFRPLLEAVARISAAVNAAEPLGNVLNTVAETTCGLLDYDFSAVLLVDERAERLLIEGSYGLSPEYVATVNTTKPIRLGSGPYGEGPSSRAFRSQKPVVVRDYLRDPAAVPWAGVAIEQGYQSLASIPLIVSGEAIGTLNCYTRSLHDFSGDEMLLLMTVANQAASAIEAARLREQEHDTILRLEEVGRSLEIQRRILERSEEIHSELTSVVLADAGLGTIASTLAKILSGTVVIDDPLGAVLASAPNRPGEAGLHGIVGSRSELNRFTEKLLADRLPRALSGADHPAFGGGAFVAPVTIGREVVARLWVLQPAGSLDGLERRALEHGATVIALELLKQRIASEVEARLGGELLDDLLEGRVADERTIQTRASHLGFDLMGRHAALVVSLDRGQDEDAGHDLESGRQRQLQGLVNLTARRLRASALVGDVEAKVVVLVGEPATAGGRGPRELADTIRSEVRRSLDGASVTIAIGPWVDRVDDIARSYSVALGAVELARRAQTLDRTVALDDLGVYGLLLTVGRLDELVAFASATIGPIREYDERRGSELLPTLRAYLRASCRTADTAATLVVHPNTVSYRIRRIEALLGVDLTQPESMLRMQLALVVDETASADRASRPGGSRTPARPRAPGGSRSTRGSAGAI